MIGFEPEEGRNILVEWVADDGVHHVEEENRELPFRSVVRNRSPIKLLLDDVGFRIEQFECIHRRRRRRRRRRHQKCLITPDHRLHHRDKKRPHMGKRSVLIKSDR